MSTPEIDLTPVIERLSANNLEKQIIAILLPEAGVFTNLDGWTGARGKN